MAYTWSIGESVFEVLIGGSSILDSKHGFVGEFPDPEAVTSFLSAYGFDVDDPIELAELQGHMFEAIRFIQSKFLRPGNPDGLKVEIPRKVLEITDIRDLFLQSSNLEAPPQIRNWCCVILKVVHTISHLDRDVRNYYFTDIQRQILDRFYKYLHRDELGALFLGRSTDDPLRVNLMEFQVKPKKARDSILVKLLQKPESVAEELFDRVGVRFLTENRADCVRVIDFLDSCRVVVAANIKPSRSRNTLVDIKAFRKILQKGSATEADLRHLLEKTRFPKSKDKDNPYSSKHYRSIQFTCRQLIKVENPLVDKVRTLKDVAKVVSLPEALNQTIQNLDTKQMPREIRFFYPFEVQVVDRESHLENERGRSAHSEYKKAQIQAAMARVMRGLQL